MKYLVSRPTGILPDRSGCNLPVGFGVDFGLAKFLVSCASRGAASFNQKLHVWRCRVDFRSVKFLVRGAGVLCTKGKFYVGWKETRDTRSFLIIQQNIKGDAGVRQATARLCSPCRMR